MISGVFAHPWALWVVVGAWILVFLETALRKQWGPGLFLRLAWTAILGGLIGDYIFIKDQKFSEPSLVHVLVDSSDSVLGIEQRNNKMTSFLTEIQAWSERERQPLKVLSFSSKVHEVDLKAGLNRADGSESHLEPAFAQLSSGEGAVILVSDGLWSDFPKPNLRTFSVQIGEENEKDVWIDSVPYSTTAFLKNRLKIPVTLEQRGYNGKSLLISLWRANEKLDEQKVSLDSRQTSVELTYFPEKMGETVLIIKVEPQNDELSTLNNQTAIRVRTVRDKIRILHIGGKPSDDLKALRLFLTRQPDVDLVSFYILRATQDDPEARNSELSLIPFPYEDLFSTELSKVDLVILHNFDFNLYFQPFYLSNLAAFVRMGGALWMIGGDQSFHRYRGSPLENLFPFEYRGSAELEKTNEPLSIKLQHPILRGSEMSLKSIDWSTRHRISSLPQALDLVQFKSGIPFLSVREAEKGRVVALNTDEFWKLQMQPTEDVAAHGRLARRLLQYLTFDPEMDPGRLISTKWNVGKPVKLQLANGERGDWKILSLHHGEFSKIVKNQAVVEFEVPAAGWYQVENSNLSESMTFETEEKPWRFEWKRLISDDRPLIKIAEQSEGKFFEWDQRENIFQIRLSGRELISSETQPWIRGAGGLTWLFLTLSLILIFLDFYFRKIRQWDL